MNSLKRVVAAAELVLIFPAVLFMTALFLRNLQPQQYEPAHTAQRIVMWYAGQVHLGLWVLLIALPLIVLVSGSATLLRAWRRDVVLREAAKQMSLAVRTQLATLLIAAATFAAGSILAVVALHVMTD